MIWKNKHSDCDKIGFNCKFLIGWFIICISSHLVRIIQKYNSLKCFIPCRKTGLQCGNCQKRVILWTHAKAFLRIETLSPSSPLAAQWRMQSSLSHTPSHAHTHPCNPALCLCSRTTASVPLHPNKVTSACGATECCNMIDKHPCARCCRPAMFGDAQRYR